MHQPNTFSQSFFPVGVTARPPSAVSFRVEDIVRIYDEHSRSGLSNREILRRYIWPKYHICEKTFYNIINASADPRIIQRQKEMRAQLSLF